MNSMIYILVVDDNQENLKVVGNYLKEKGYKIAFALNGKSAIKAVETNKIDLILLDIMMPEMDGFETCRLLKQNSATSQVPVIFLSAKNETDDIAQCYNSGGEDYIQKPFKKEELFARVAAHVKIKRVKDIVNQYKDTPNSSVELLLEDLSIALNTKT